MPAETKPNADLIREIKQALALAESGAITNGVFIGHGADVYHRTFSIPLPQDMATMIGETNVFAMEMQLLLLGNRTSQEQSRASGILGRRPGGPAFKL